MVVAAVVTPIRPNTCTPRLHLLHSRERASTKTHAIDAYAVTDALFCTVSEADDANVRQMCSASHRGSRGSQRNNRRTRRAHEQSPRFYANQICTNRDWRREIADSADVRNAACAACVSVRQGSESPRNAEASTTHASSARM